MRKLLFSLHRFDKSFGHAIFIINKFVKQKITFLAHIYAQMTKHPTSASAEVAFLHPTKLNVSKNATMSYNKPLLTAFITNFGFYM